MSPLSVQRIVVNKDCRKSTTLLASVGANLGK